MTTGKEKINDNSRKKNGKINRREKQRTNEIGKKKRTMNKK